MEWLYYEITIIEAFGLSVLGFTMAGAVLAYWGYELGVQEGRKYLKHMTKKTDWHRGRMGRHEDCGGCPGDPDYLYMETRKYKDEVETIRE